MNIRMIMISRPASERAPVMPVDSPTVANAETASNSVSVSPNPSVMDSANVAVITEISPKRRTVNAVAT